MTVVVVEHFFVSVGRMSGFVFCWLFCVGTVVVAVAFGRLVYGFVRQIVGVGLFVRAVCVGHAIALLVGC